MHRSIPNGGCKDSNEHLTAMINRILIRIKVVQLLYSYMLTRSDFHILGAPEKNTRDSRFAYTFYIQTLLLITKLSGQKYSATDRLTLNMPMKNPFLSIGKALASNTDIKEIVSKRHIDLSDYTSVVQYLLDKIASTSIYQEYGRKRKIEIDDEVKVWCALIESVLMKDERLREAARNNEDFTIAGFERGLQMAMETLRDYSETSTSLISARKSLQDSLDKAYQLYIGLLMLPVEITRLREEQIESAKDKYLPSADDLNPNLKFIDNGYVAAVGQCKELENEFKAPIISRTADYYLVKKLLDQILDSDIYKRYMDSQMHSSVEDCEFWRDIMKEIILPSDDLAEALESKSIYWNDDLTIVGGFVLKTIRRCAVSDIGCMLSMLPQFKDDEDARFGEQLFTYAVNNQKEYREIIDSFINPAQWDSGRLALMDIVIMTAALAEILHFPLIPVPVSINEYVEIANYYGNSHSGQFINGLLFSALNRLRDEGKLKKQF